MKRGAASLAAVLATISCLGACGSSSSNTTPPPASITVAQGSLIVPSHGFVPLSMTTTATGTLNVQLNLSSNIVVTGIFTSGCTVGGQGSGCTYLNITEVASTSSSKTLAAPGAAAASYVVLFG